MKIANEKAIYKKLKYDNWKDKNIGLLFYKKEVNLISKGVRI